MEIVLPKEKTYVAAVSGGVDSMVLLNLLIKNAASNKWDIIVAHVDHGIRPDSGDDKNLVETVADRNNLTFESTSLNLGPAASEALAREARYEFLEDLQNKYAADSILTAHHQDDLIETAILNLIRGTGRKGLTSLLSNKTRLRPLINYPKTQILDYAELHNIEWREDSTNSDLKYLRNYVRRQIVPRFDSSARTKLLNVINSMSGINEELDAGLSKLIADQGKPNTLTRTWFNSLNHSLAKEVMATWLRQNGLSDFNRSTLERLVVSAKVASSNQRFPIIQDRYLIINKNLLSLSPGKTY